ncbi:hypothetical protein CWI38_1596p0030 [Hamiltosporidium tvaerminnensis]|uniref:Uncharacterized protein n=2 Tax=Hamiltosporidium TaxID=1176354 RepID=A0A4Q9LAU2_9MICR|nr:hypothetical protein LUQ84_002621 [Hamiltosporidium tvaerminnensis]TBU04435.1 hypothetical protein CWI36_0763p0040 [Hamiltosporidium magnivora]TBU10708.1 hypothetical protein CWI38_1596p0030 [Hamiltosporidium tvaerminnensis]
MILFSLSFLLALYSCAENLISNGEMQNVRNPSLHNSREPKSGDLSDNLFNKISNVVAEFEKYKSTFLTENTQKDD